MPEETPSPLDAALERVQAARNKYEILEVPPSANGHEIRRAYRRLALLYHPDRAHEAERETAHLIFGEMTAAYRVLIDPEKRPLYDRALARGEEYRESAEAGDGPNLSSILTDIELHEHVFTEGTLDSHDDKLRSIVTGNLIAELGEKVVFVCRLLRPPSSAAKATLKAGALVITNLRLLLPYCVEWEGTEDGNKVKYTSWSMPNYPFPEVRKLILRQSGHAWPEFTLTIETEEGSEVAGLPNASLALLLVVAHSWEVPVETQWEPARQRESRFALAEAWQTSAICFVCLMALAAGVGLFFGRLIDTPVWLWETCAEFGVWQIWFFLTACLSAKRLTAWWTAHQNLNLLALLANAPAAVKDEKEKAAVAVSASSL